MEDIKIVLKRAAAYPPEAADQNIGFGLKELNERLALAKAQGMSTTTLTDDEMLDTEADILAARISCIPSACVDAHNKYVDLLVAKGVPEGLLPERRSNW